MNACGQHSIAQIGFYGMSIKKDKLIIPAFQVLLGGGVIGNGEGNFSNKIIKIPSKKGPEALRILLTDYETQKSEEELFNDYYARKGKDYFYQLLKPLANIHEVTNELLVDWGHDQAYIKAIGVGECAGVIIDLVSTLLFESEEKIENARLGIENQRWADSIYHSYSALLNTAKAVLIGENLKTNTQHGIINDFDQYFIQSGLIELDGSFSELILQIKKNKATEAFANQYLNDAIAFYKTIDSLRSKTIKNES